MGRLSAKRRAFVEEYLSCWNASEAARRAGYAHPRRQGSRLLSFVDIQALIKARLAEKAMSADEALTRLAEQGRGGWTEYLLEDGSIDLARLLEDGKGHLVKGTKWDRQGNLVVEFYDAQAALVHIGRHHKLFTDRKELDLAPDLKTDAKDKLAQLLNRLAPEGTESGADQPTDG